MQYIYYYNNMQPPIATPINGLVNYTGQGRTGHTNILALP